MSTSQGVTNYKLVPLLRLHTNNDNKFLQRDIAVKHVVVLCSFALFGTECSFKHLPLSPFLNLLSHHLPPSLCSESGVGVGVGFSGQ